MRRYSLLIVPAVLCAGLSACAKAPDSIAPAYVSDVPYQSFSCAQLSEEVARLDTAYATAATQQTQARSNDVAGVILLGLPVSSLSGDNIAPQIANLKGQKDAVAVARRKKGC